MAAVITETDRLQAALDKALKSETRARKALAILRGPAPANDSLSLIALDAATYAEGAGEPEFSCFLRLEARIRAAARSALSKKSKPRPSQEGSGK